VALFTGAVGSIRQGIESWLADSKVILSIGTWLVYAVILAARTAALLNGRKVAVVSVVGMVMIVFTFIVTEAVLPGWHSYGWKSEAAVSTTRDGGGAPAASPGESRE